MALSRDAPERALEGTQEVKRSLLSGQCICAIVPWQSLAAPWTAERGTVVIAGGLPSNHKRTVWTTHTMSQEGSNKDKDSGAGGFIWLSWGSGRG